MRPRRLSAALLEAAGVPAEPHSAIAHLARVNGIPVVAVEHAVDEQLDAAQAAHRPATTPAVVEALGIALAFQNAGAESRAARGGA
jgi:hypothetical protein